MNINKNIDNYTAKHGYYVCMTILDILIMMRIDCSKKINCLREYFNYLSRKIIVLDCEITILMFYFSGYKSA